MINFSEKISFKQKRISCYICLGAVTTSLACQCNPNGEQKCTVVAETVSFTLSHIVYLPVQDNNNNNNNDTRR